MVLDGDTCSADTLESLGKGKLIEERFEIFAFDCSVDKMILEREHRENIVKHDCSFRHTATDSAKVCKRKIHLFFKEGTAIAPHLVDKHIAEFALRRGNDHFLFAIADNLLESSHLRLNLNEGGCDFRGGTSGKLRSGRSNVCLVVKGTESGIYIVDGNGLDPGTGSVHHCAMPFDSSLVAIHGNL